MGAGADVGLVPTEIKFPRHVDNRVCPRGIDLNNERPRPRRKEQP